MKEKKLKDMKIKKKKTVMIPTDKNSSKSLDDFVSTWSDEDDSDDDENEITNGHLNSEQEDCPNLNGATGDSSSSESDDSDASVTEEKGQVAQQKEYLAGLKNKDPEFYKYLKENDEELLNFDEASSDEENSEENEEKLHRPPESLEVASDESDFEMDDDEPADKKSSSSTNKSISINKKQVDKWTEEIRQKPDVKIIGIVVRAFRGAIQNIHDQEESNDAQDTKDAGKPSKKRKKKSHPKELKENDAKYVTGSGGGAAFNSIARLCLSELTLAVSKVLKIEDLESNQGKDPKKSKAWPKLNKYLKMYTMDLTKLLKSGGSGEPGSVISAVLKHVHGLIPYYSVLPKSSKILVKNLVTLWSSHNEESVRVLAFMCLLRLARRAMKSNGMVSVFILSKESRVSKKMINICTLDKLVNMLNILIEC